MTEFGRVMWDSLRGASIAVANFLPALFGAVIILIVGWALSSVIARLLERGLRAVGVDRAVERSGIGNFIRGTGADWTGSMVFSVLAKWFIRLIFIQAAANVLGMPQVTGIINSIVLFIPNVVVAVAVLVVGSLVARFLGGLAQASASEMAFANPQRLGALAHGVVMAFAVIVAFSQLGIAQPIVNSLFTGLIAAISLAIGLSFGLGSKDVAGEIVRNWYQKGGDITSRPSEGAHGEQHVSH